MADALEAEDHGHVIELAESIGPGRIPMPARRANYWINYGRALARVRARYDDAVMALYRAERISADTHQRDPFVRETLAELLLRSKRDAIGREQRGMAYRAGLPV